MTPCCNWCRSQLEYLNWSLAMGRIFWCDQIFSFCISHLLESLICMSLCHTQHHIRIEMTVPWVFPLQCQSDRFYYSKYTVLMMKNEDYAKKMSTFGLGRCSFWWGNMSKSWFELIHIFYCAGLRVIYKPWIKSQPRFSTTTIKIICKNWEDNLYF